MGGLRCKVIKSSSATARGTETLRWQFIMETYLILIITNARVWATTTSPKWWWMSDHATLTSMKCFRGFLTKSLLCGERKFNVKIILDESRKENMKVEKKICSKHSAPGVINFNLAKNVQFTLMNAVIWWIQYTANVITSLREKKLPIDAIWWNSYE